LVDREFRAVPFDFGGVVLNYDSALLKDPPQTWEELLDPRFEDSIILMNPATSSPGRNFLLLTVEQFGEDGYLEFWRRLKPNVLTVTGGWSEGYGLYVQGEAPIVLSYDTSPAYHREFESTDRYRTLVLGDSAYAQVEVAGVVRDAANAINARRCMDFIVSPEFQQHIPLSQFMYPIHPDVELPDSFAAVRRAANLVTLDSSSVEEDFDRWAREWEAVMR
jgi:thiamine transport system substrate-binding protein